MRRVLRALVEPEGRRRLELGALVDGGSRRRHEQLDRGLVEQRARGSAHHGRRQLVVVELKAPREDRVAFLRHSDRARAPARLATIRQKLDRGLVQQRAGGSAHHGWRHLVVDVIAIVYESPESPLKLLHFIDLRIVCVCVFV